MVDVLSIFEEEDEQVGHVFITPPDPELDGDSEGEFGERRWRGYVDNLARSLLQADSIAILSNGRTIGEEYAEGNGHTDLSQFPFPKTIGWSTNGPESCSLGGLIENGWSMHR